MAHVVQGGLEDAAPGSADVVGYTYYANCYTSLYEANTKAALGLRYRYEDKIEAGITIPSGVTTSAPLFNAALKVHPVKLFTVSIAYEGILRSNGNLYTGMTFDFDYVILDAYLAINFRNTRLIIDTAPDQWGSHWGTGAATDRLDLFMKSVDEIRDSFDKFNINNLVTIINDDIANLKFI